MRLAFGVSPEAKILGSRMAGEELLLTPGKLAAWREQSDRMVQNLMRNHPDQADDIYLRMIRLRYRFLEEMPSSSKLMQGSYELSIDELLLAKRIASEEFVLREPSWTEKLQGFRSNLEPGRIEFVRLADRVRGFGGTKQQFLNDGVLSAAKRGSAATAYDRAVLALRQFAEGREMAYIMTRTPEGSKLLDLVFQPGPRLFQDPAEQFVERLAADPARRVQVIDLAFRFSRVFELYESRKIKFRFTDGSPMGKKALVLLSNQYLKLGAT